MDISAIGAQLSVWLVPVLLAITLHEAAHAWAADRLGDDTSRRLGRITLNPLKHADPIGTFLLPGLLLLTGAPFLFGFAKPVPVAFHRLRNPKRDMALVAAAGPGINVLLAFVAALLVHPTVQLPGAVGEWTALNLANAVQINLFLAVFNMLPLPPLDGGRVLTGLLPRPYDWKFARVERYGFVILLAIFILGPIVGQALGLPGQPIWYVLAPPYEFLLNLVLTLAGIR